MDVVKVEHGMWEPQVYSAEHSAPDFLQIVKVEPEALEAVDTKADIAGVKSEALDLVESEGCTGVVACSCNRVLKMNDKFMEQRIIIKFLVKLNESATDIFDKLKLVYAEDAMSRSRVFEWAKRFAEGRMDVNDDARSGRPSIAKTDVNVERVRMLVRSDGRLTVRLIADQLNLNRETVRLILTEKLNMRKVCAKMVPKNLSNKQKEGRLQVCSDLSERLHSENRGLLNKIITGGETWVYQYEPETKHQSLQWKTPSSPRPKKARMSKSKVTTMLICFFDIKGIVHKEFVRPGQAVNQTFYRDVLESLRKRVLCVRPELAPNKWILHHDNTPAHTTLSVMQLLADKQITVLEHPPYSPDLAPCDFFLFPRLKTPMKGTHFASVEEIQRAVTNELNGLSDNDFQGCFKAWQRRWQACIDSQGDYFEGDHSLLLDNGADTGARC
uniref:Mos1 transposase HTH domain-containing protein n=1 Tax=Eptatretus burgeri TaxID=7764 RepID=A0A8C4QZV8_EPTBU